MKLIPDIVVMLNEQERPKEAAANDLCARLSERGYSVDRLVPSPQTLARLTPQSARVFVLDYLLGNVTTAIDVLRHWNETRDDGGTGSSPSPAVIVWTDEPSLSVAVAAMRLGASDYIELGSSRSVEKLLEALERLTDTAARKRHERGTATSSPTSLSHNYILTEGAVHQAGRRDTPITVLLGPRGSGRSFLGRALHEHRPRAGLFREYALDSHRIDPARLVGSRRALPFAPPLLTAAVTILLDRIEYADSDLLSALVSEKEWLWSEHAAAETPVLVLGTTVHAVAKTWATALGASIIPVPSLSERREDLAPLTEWFWHQLGPSQEEPLFRRYPTLIEVIEQYDWPGNLNELRAAVEAVYVFDAYRRRERPNGRVRLTNLELRSAIEEGQRRWQLFAPVPWNPAREEGAPPPTHQFGT